jgi:hypothetical protein
MARQPGQKRKTHRPVAGDGGAAPPGGAEADAPRTRNLTAAGGDAPPPAPEVEPLGAPTPLPPARLTVEVVCGPITQVKAPIALVGQYRGVAPCGFSRQYDKALDEWLSRALEFDMAGCGLGQLFFVPTARKKAEGKVAQAALIMAGMGDPGRFTRDDLSYLMTNVTLAVKALEEDELVMPLIGVRRGELSLARAVRALLDGVVAGLERFPEPVRWGLRIKLVEPKVKVAQAIYDILRDLVREQRATEQAEGPQPVPGAHVVLAPLRQGPAGAEEPPDDADARDVYPHEPTTRITISCPQAADGRAPAATLVPTSFEYTAITQSAVIPVREVEVQSYFTRRLPGRLQSAPWKDQEALGKFLANYLLPEDFRKFIEAGTPVTLVLDPGAAVIPWEMAAFTDHSGTSYYGPDLELTRQFRTPLSAAPGLAPPLNHTLNVLVIADPAPGALSLPEGAREEGFAVVQAFQQARAAFRQAAGRDTKQRDVRLTVRIGAPGTPGVQARLDGLGGWAAGVISARACDPLEVLSLIVNGGEDGRGYDVVHFAGHGVFDPETRRMGWVFDADCVLSAQEIFRVRQVPRLVFANACHSAEVTPEGRVVPGPASAPPGDPERGRLRQVQQVSLAEAFFARGIENYIGAGWSVDDAQAQEFARQFYYHALNLDAEGQRVTEGDKAPPGILGEALAVARRAVRAQSQGTTWAAYQHYGEHNAKLFPYANVDRDPDDEA